MAEPEIDQAPHEIISGSEFETVTNKQRNIKRIVEHETDRIDRKNKASKDRETGMNRLVLLSDSYLQKQKMLYLILFISVFIFVFCFGLVTLQNKLGFSKAITNVILFIAILIAVGTSYYLYSSIQKRDVIDFSKINHAELEHRDIKDTISETNSNYNLNVNYENCVGEECCGPGFAYDFVEKVCIAQ